MAQRQSNVSLTTKHRRCLTVNVYHACTLRWGLDSSREESKHPRRRKELRSHLNRLSSGSHPHNSDEWHHIRKSINYNMHRRTSRASKMTRRNWASGDVVLIHLLGLHGINCVRSIVFLAWFKVARRYHLPYIRAKCSSRLIFLRSNLHTRVLHLDFRHHGSRPYINMIPCCKY